jgi:putative hydrolase of the HAD superfamily
LPDIRAIFWDVGGVLLTNAWDHTQRAAALNHFRLDEKEFQSRHEMLVSAFERGKLSLDEYLRRTVFYREREFSQQIFQQFMFSQSQPLPNMLEFARSLTTSKRYFMGTINNESRELNLYRIEQFGLREIFQVFVSSCFVGLRKPEMEIYKTALELTQFPAEQCCFIDDRPLNLECAAHLGMHTVEKKTLEQLRADLAAMGVRAA